MAGENPIMERRWVLGDSRDRNQESFTGELESQDAGFSGSGEAAATGARGQLPFQELQ